MGELFRQDGPGRSRFHIKEQKGSMFYTKEQRGESGCLPTGFTGHMLNFFHIHKCEVFMQYSAPYHKAERLKTF